MRQKAFEIRGQAVPPLQVPAAPRLLDITDKAAFLGKAVQAHSLTMSNGPKNPTAAGPSSAKMSVMPPFSTARSFPIQPPSPDENTIPRQSPKLRRYFASSNVVGPVYAVFHTLIDEMGDMKQINTHGGTLSLEVKNPQFKKTFTLRGTKNAYNIYKTKSPFGHQDIFLL
jgi:hypothetical protein